MFRACSLKGRNNGSENKQLLLKLKNSIYFKA